MDPGARNDAGPAMADADTERHTDSGRIRDADAYTERHTDPGTHEDAGTATADAHTEIRTDSGTRDDAGPATLTPTPERPYGSRRARRRRDPRR